MIIKLFQIASFRVLALVVLTGLAGCITTADAENRWGYICTDGYEFIATYARNDKSVVIKDANQEFRLKSLEAASGGRYSDGSMDLWAKGFLAFIKVGGEMLHPNCTGSQL